MKISRIRGRAFPLNSFLPRIRLSPNVPFLNAILQGRSPTELTPLIQTKVDSMIDKVLTEIARLGEAYYLRSTDYVPGYTFKDCRN